MATIRIPEAVRRVFTETFIARDIAQPLASFDAATPGADVRAFMAARQFDVVGIRNGGLVDGYVVFDSLGQGACGLARRDFEEAMVLNDSTPLLSVMRMLSQAPYLFVRVLGQVGGIITPTDLQKPPVRMWLFGIVTLIEMRCTELIERHCPAEAWRAFLSEARWRKAEALLAERGRRNQALQLLDCLQFSDKGQIIARNEELRQQTAFPSRRQAEEAIKRLEQLRNNLAHAQDILVSDWDTIVKLCDFIAQP